MCLLRITPKKRNLHLPKTCVPDGHRLNVAISLSITVPSLTILLGSTALSFPQLADSPTSSPSSSLTMRCVGAYTMGA